MSAVYELDDFEQADWVQRESDVGDAHIDDERGTDAED